MTKKRPRSRLFRAREREFVRSVRYYLKHRNYTEALRALGWALQQATAADEAEHAEKEGTE